MWETIPQPSWEDFQFGGNNGYLDLFVKQDGGYARQWKYTDAPDADARAVQAVYWAKLWADEQGGGGRDRRRWSRRPPSSATTFATRSSTSTSRAWVARARSCPAARATTARTTCSSWYYAWGGSISKAGGWSWRIGSSTAHFGYQNPFAAWVLANDKAFKPLSPNGASDWAKSLDRQLEFYRWLQSSEGGIAGGATNSWRGRYEQFPANVPTFYRLAYDEAPVYVDPPSNKWFGFQAWSMDRVAQLYYVTGNEHAKVVLDQVGEVGAGQRASRQGRRLRDSIGPRVVGRAAAQLGRQDAELERQGRELQQDPAREGQDLRPGPGRGRGAGANPALLRQEVGRQRAGQAGQGAARPHVEEVPRRQGRRRSRDSAPISSASPTRSSYPRAGKARCRTAMPWIRTRPLPAFARSYTKDPEWPKIQAAMQGGAAPTFTYHRFWAQADIALANATFAMLYPDGIKSPAAAAADAKAKGKGRTAGKAKGRKK